MTTTALLQPPMLLPPIPFPCLERVAHLGRWAAQKGYGVIIKGAPGAGVTTALRAFLDDFVPELSAQGATHLSHAFYGPNLPLRALRRVFGREDAIHRKLERIFCLEKTVELCLRYLAEHNVRLLVLDRCDHLEPSCVEVFLRLSAEQAARGHPLGVVLAGRPRGSASFFPWTTGGLHGGVLAFDLPKLTREEVFTALVDHWLIGRLNDFKAAVLASDKTALQLLDDTHRHADGVCGRLHGFVRAVELLQPAGPLDERILRQGLRDAFWQQ